MFEPTNFYIDDGLEDIGTSLVDLSDETPEETSYRRLAEESWRKYLNLRRNPVSGVSSSQAQTSHSLVPSPASLRAVREYRIIGAAPRRSSLAPRSASHRIAFDRRSGSCLNPIPITWLGVAGILVSTRLLHAQPILTLSCGDLLRYFN